MRRDRPRFAVVVAELFQKTRPKTGSSMGLDLSPRDYLEMLTDEYREYRLSHDRTLMRKAINCCGLSNARCPKLSPPIATPPILRRFSR